MNFCQKQKLCQQKLCQQKLCQQKLCRLCVLLLVSLVNQKLQAAAVRNFDKEVVVSEIKALQQALSQQTVVLEEQNSILSQDEAFNSDIPHYEPWDNALYQAPENCTDAQAVKQGKEAYRIGSYITLALATIPSLIGPVVEAYRHHVTFNVRKRAVLWTAFAWPVAATVGNILFDLHVVTNQEENTTHKILNGLPSTLVVLGSLYTVASLVYYGRKYSFQLGW